MSRCIYKNIFFSLLLVVAFQITKAATIIITADSISFTPDTLHARIGDTISWVWVKGIHTTSSNGIPDGATPWNALLDSMHTHFEYVITKGGLYSYLSVPDIPIMQGFFAVAFPTGISSLQNNTPSFNIVMNPVHDVVITSFSIPSFGKTEIDLYDVSGRKIKTLLSESLPSGKYAKSIPLQSDITPGIYLLYLRWNEKGVTRKVVVE